MRIEILLKHPFFFLNDAVEQTKREHLTFSSTASDENIIILFVVGLLWKGLFEVWTRCSVTSTWAEQTVSLFLEGLWRGLLSLKKIQMRLSLKTKQKKSVIISIPRLLNMPMFKRVPMSFHQSRDDCIYCNYSIILTFVVNPPCNFLSTFLSGDSGTTEIGNYTDRKAFCILLLLIYYLQWLWRWSGFQRQRSQAGGACGGECQKYAKSSNVMRQPSGEDKRLPRSQWGEEKK